MIRNLKALGLAALAVCALGAFSAASASAAEFHSSVEHSVLDGTQIGTDVFTTNAGEVSCTEATYTGTQTAKTTTTQSSLAKYSGCTAFGFAAVPITVNGCEYVFHAAATNTVDIVCPAGKTIEVLAPNCTVTVGSQNGKTAVTFATEGKSPKRDVKVNVNLAGLTYTQHPKGFFPCASGTFTNGTYKGEATVIGTDTNGNQVDAWYL
jgi:hypothetical protein